MTPRPLFDPGPLTETDMSRLRTFRELWLIQCAFQLDHLTDVQPLVDHLRFVRWRRRRRLEGRQ